MKQDFNDPIPPPEPTRHDVTAFISAAENNDITAVERYLAAFPTQIMIAKNDAGDTALMWAAAGGHDNVVALLLERGAMVDNRNLFGFTALFYAAVKDQPAVMTLLLKKGADIDAKSGTGETALFYAAKSGYRTCTALLLEKGARTEEKDNDGNTAQMLAARNGHHAIAAMIGAEEARREEALLRRERELEEASRLRELKEVAAEVHNGITEEMAVEPLRFKKKDPAGPA
jgi:ankyrin repeat protein